MAPQEARQVPSTLDRVKLLVDWVEKGVAPGKSIVVTGGGRSLPMCSYPEYPKYNKGPVDAAETDKRFKRLGASIERGPRPFRTK